MWEFYKIISILYKTSSKNIPHLCTNTSSSPLNTKNMFYDNYYYGMNPIWWVIWVILIFWIFAVPYAIPGQMHKRDTAFEVLRKRFAAGQISAQEYAKDKEILEKDLAK